MGLLSRSSKSDAQAVLSPVEDWVLRYGDIVFDFFITLLQNKQNAQILLRETFLELKQSKAGDQFKRFERAWVLSVATEKVKKAAMEHAPRLSASDQIDLDSSADPAKKLAQFDLYFRKLAIEDQILLLLKDKYGVPMPEIASVLGRAEESLKLQRSQALRTLEEWVWENA